MIPDDVFATVPVLTGRRLRLEPLGPAVAEPYWRMLQEEEGLRLTGTHATLLLRRARRVYEECGFRVEGRRREALLQDGVRHDAVLMAVLRTHPR